MAVFYYIRHRNLKIHPDTKEMPGLMVIRIASIRNYKTIVITVLNAKAICLGIIALFSLFEQLRQ